MLAAIDNETQGLDARKFIIGTLILENKEQPETYTNKQELWNRIKQIGEAENKRKKTLTIYAHNAAFDFYGYADLNDKNIKYFCTTPFIASYTKEKKETIKFLDTYGIFKMPLEQLGETIGLPKLEMPKYLQEENTRITQKRIEEMKPYNIRDTQIVLKAIQYLKEVLKEDNIQLKRLITINQIAIQYTINKLQKQPKENTEHIFWNRKTGEIRRTFRAEEIHAAYRGGRVETWKTGNIENTTGLDKRNLYGSELAKMKCPDLRTERKTWQPLKKGIQKEQILNAIGITRCLIKNKTNNLGLLQIRTPDSNYYPKEQKYLIGTWTNQELQLAEQEGYEIIDIEWTITYETAKINPFKEIMQELYKKRTENRNDKFKYWFYKQMQNSSIGKMAQYKNNQEITIDTVEAAQQYLEKMYKITKAIGNNYMYTKQEGTKRETKKYYCPIIPCLVNANARITMYKEYKKIPQEDLIYTDTDSIKFKGNHKQKFEIGEQLGQFKIEHENTPMKIYAKKTYMESENIRIAGIHTKKITKEDFEKGIVKGTEMIGIKTTKNIDQVGSFIETTRDLKEQQEKYEKAQKILETPTLYIDNDIQDITYFIPTIIEKIQNI